MKKNNTPRRKRLTKEQRLRSSKEWIGNYDGKNIVKGYAKWYGVDLLSAIKELRMNGVIVDEEYEGNIKESFEAKKLASKIIKETSNKELIDSQDEFLDNKFAFIAGYTSGGAAYGTTHEEIGNHQEDE